MGCMHDAEVGAAGIIRQDDGSTVGKDGKRCLA